MFAQRTSLQDGMRDYGMTPWICKANICRCFWTSK